MPERLSIDLSDIVLQKSVRCQKKCQKICQIECQNFSFKIANFYFCLEKNHSTIIKGMKSGSIIYPGTYSQKLDGKNQIYSYKHNNIHHKFGPGIMIRTTLITMET